MTVVIEMGGNQSGWIRVHVQGMNAFSGKSEWRGEVNLAYELLNIQQSIDGLMSILSLFIIHVALVHVRIE